MRVPIKKGAKKYYKNEGKKEKQATNFNELLKTVKEKNEALRIPDKYPDYNSRLSEII